MPRALRGPIYRTYSRYYDVDLGELRLPLEEHPSFGAFFVRRLADGARKFPVDAGVLPAPCDGTLQASDAVDSGSILQAKGRSYSVRELLAGADHDVDLEGGHAWTIYLSPRDYHRVHSPVEARLSEVRWAAGARFSVAPKVLVARQKVLSINERAVLRLETAHGPLFLVMVGALNVGRIRVVGIEPGRSGRVEPAREFRRGDELARFEMGSTVVLVAPASGPKPSPGLALGQRIRMGEAIGRV